jgi:hypothetical protein
MIKKLSRAYVLRFLPGQCRFCFSLFSLLRGSSRQLFCDNLPAVLPDQRNPGVISFFGSIDDYQRASITFLYVTLRRAPDKRKADA